LIGKPPFETSDTKTTYNRILKNNYSFPTNTPISEEAKDLIKKILVLEPSKRLTLDEILQHPFIKNNSSKNLTQSNDFELKKTNTNLSLGSPNGMVSPTTKDIDLDRNIDENEVNEKGSDPNSIQMKERTKTLKDRPMSTDPKMVRNFTLNDGIVPRTLGGLNSGMPSKLNLLGFDTGVYVSKWVDYSTKYGLGYLLSDGTAGVVFNDSTRITMSNNSQKFEYMEKKPEQKREILSTYSLTNYPKELNKKYLLLQHFKNYLAADDKSEREEFSPDPNASKKGLNYIKKWMKTKYAFMFRLSNRLVQVDFTDKTQIILNPESQVVHYKNKKGERTQHALATALESDYAEMVKRLKYTKEILTHIHNSNQKDVEIKLDTKGMTIGTGFLSTKDFNSGGTGKIPKIQGTDDLEN
jgi:polo-like kinase 1